MCLGKSEFETDDDVIGVQKGTYLLLDFTLGTE